MVGGGLAGITASLVLAKHGIRVQLLESRRRLGGRVGSFADAHSGETVDYCQHVGMGCCSNLKQLIDWLGHREYWDVHRQLHFYGPDGRYQRLAAWPFVPAPLHISGWLWRWPGLTLRDRISLVRGIIAIQRLKISTATDAVEAEAWLCQRGQTPQAIDRFWRTIVVSALGEELQRVSLSAVAKVIQDGFLNHRDAFHLLVPNKPLGDLFGSMTERVLVESGVDLRLGTRVQSIVPSAAGGVTVAVDQLGQTDADAVIIAVPWFRIGDLLANSEVPELQRVQQQARQLASSPISGVHTWWDRPWLETPHAAIVGRLSQWVFPKTDAVLNRSADLAEHYYQIVISASRQLPRGDSALVAEQIEADLAAVFPAARRAKLLRLQTVTDPHSVFSLTPEAVQLRPLPRVGSTRIWLAGDWVQTGWPATMEGAIISGRQAAEQILGLAPLR